MVQEFVLEVVVSVNVWESKSKKNSTLLSFSLLIPIDRLVVRFCCTL